LFMVKPERGQGIIAPIFKIWLNEKLIQKIKFNFARY
jgi:hypothetical protein